MVTALAVGVAFAALTAPAEAQTVDAFVTWMTGPAAIGGMVALAVALVGLMLLFGQHTFIAIAFFVLGALIIGNARTIGAFFPGGG